MSSLNPTDRINLKDLVNQFDCDDNTDNIRNLKHSVLIRDDIRNLENIKLKEAELKKWDIEKFTELCQEKCHFLFNNYTDIFNKVLKDEIDLDIMTKLLIVLKLIEDGKVDQHEGSAMVGKILKELYIDSAVKAADNLDKKYDSERTEPNDGMPISWKEYKRKNI